MALLSWNYSLVSYLKSNVRRQNKLQSGNLSRTHVWSLARGIYSNNSFPSRRHGTIFRWFRHPEVTFTRRVAAQVTFEIPKCHVAERPFKLISSWSPINSFVKPDSCLAVCTSWTLRPPDGVKRTVRKHLYVCRNWRMCHFFICFRVGEPFNQPFQFSFLESVFCCHVASQSCTCSHTNMLLREHFKLSIMEILPQAHMWVLSVFHYLSNYSVLSNCEKSVKFQTQIDSINVSRASV